MPILQGESDIFPEDLFELPTADAPWEIAHLRSRQEKSVARLLLEGGKPFYLPQVRQTTKRAGRTFVRPLRLFPANFFLRRGEGLRQTLCPTSPLPTLFRAPTKAQPRRELLQTRELKA